MPISLDPETTNASEGRDSKIGFVTDFIVNLLMMLIIVTLLPGLSNLQILSNDADFLLSLIDHIRTESGLSPVSDQFSGVRHFRP